MLMFFLLFHQNRQPMITQMSSVSNVNLPLRASAPNQVWVAQLSHMHLCMLNVFSNLTQFNQNLVKLLLFDH